MKIEKKNRLKWSRARSPLGKALEQLKPGESLLISELTCGITESTIRVQATRYAKMRGLRMRVQLRDEGESILITCSRKEAE